MSRKIGALLTTALLTASLSLSSNIYAQAPYSARIRALGGSAVSGIIPDTLTDLAINPSYIALSNRLSLTLQLYDRSEPVLYFPIHNHYLYLYNDFETYDIKRITASGMKMKDWFLLLSAGWHIKNTDDSNIRYYQYIDSKFPSVEKDQWTNRHYEEYLTANINIARYISRETIVGLKFRIDDTYKKDTSHRNDITVHYYINDDRALLDRINKRYAEQEKTWRRFEPSIELSLLRLEKGRPRNEYSLSISRNDASHISMYDEAQSRTDYNNMEILTDHDFSEEITRENNRGNIWSMQFETRQFLHSGFIVYFSSSYSFSRYSARWLINNDYYDWSTDDDLMNSSGFKCSGNLDGVAIMLKTGKRYRLGNKMYITGGVRSSYSGEWISEKPLIHFNKIHETDTVTALSSRELHLISSKDISASIGFPIAFEFIPVRYFSFYAGYYVALSYHHYFDKNVPIPAASPEEYYLRVSNRGALQGSHATCYGSMIPYELTGNEKERFEGLKYLTLGFAFDVKDRFFIDLYTKSDLSLSYLRSATADLRFAF